MHKRALVAAIFLLLPAARADEQVAAGEPLTRHEDIAALVEAVDPARLEADVRRLAGFGTRHSFSRRKDPDEGVTAARVFVRERFEEIAKTTDGRLEVMVEEIPAQLALEPPPVRLYNVQAVLPGRHTDPPRPCVVVVAHYDSRVDDPRDALSDAPGADDNASGVAAVLETARLLSPQEYESTLIFAALCGNSQNLVGGKALARWLSRHRYQPVAVINLDSLANTKGPGGREDRAHVRVFSEGVPISETGRERLLRLVGGTDNDSPSRQVARYLAAVARTYVPPLAVHHVFRADRLARDGDQLAFHARGFPAVRVSEMVDDPRRHNTAVRVEAGVQYGDLPDGLDYDYLAEVTRLVVAGAACLASAPPPPAFVRLRTSVSTAQAVLTWGASPGTDVAGYEVLWRPTASLEWEHVRPVGEVTEYRLDVPPDLYQFGVRAVSSSEYRSPVVTAVPDPR